MKPEAQRIAIAKACGWKKTHILQMGIKGKYVATYQKGRGKLHQKLPDYLNSLDAMHQAEFATFTAGGSWSRYYSYLSDVCNAEIDDDKRNSPMSATAAQRTEAFLKTLNLWTDET